MQNNKKDKWVEIYYNYLGNKYDASNDLEQITRFLVVELENSIRKGTDGNFFMDDDAFDDMRARFIFNLKTILSRISHNNKQDKVLDVCKLFINLEKIRSYIPFAIESFFYPQDAYITDPYEYRRIWGSIIREYITNNSQFDRKYFNVLDDKTKEILNAYREYIHNIQINESKDYGRKILFKKYMNTVIAFYYKENYDINLFQRVLDYVFNNAEKIEDYYELNGADTDENIKIELDEMLITQIMDDVVNIKPNIL